MINPLAKKECVPCKGGVPPLDGDPLISLHRTLGGDWKLSEDLRLEKEYRFNNFRQALRFTNQVGELAEVQGHHPDICLGWGKAKLVLWTHKIGGLSESDFIFAAKVDEIQSAH